MTTKLAVVGEPEDNRKLITINGEESRELMLMIALGALLAAGRPGCRTSP